MQYPTWGCVEAKPATLALYLLFALLTSTASMYVWAGHTRHVYWCASMLAVTLLGPMAFAVFVYCPVWLRALLGSRSLWLVCIAAITVTDVSRHSRVAFDPHPNTAASALVQPARQLAHGRDPYEVRLADGAPISPGPGWIILLAPLTLLGGVAVLTGLVVGLCTFLVGARSPTSAGLIVVFVLVQPVLLMESMVGHDLFVIPIFFAVLCLLAERWIGNSSRLVALALIAAAFATSRLPMFFCF